MDALTHLFLPATVAYAALHERFDSPRWLALAGLGLLADFDKYLGAPGLLHSLVPVVPLSVGLLAVGRYRDAAPTLTRLAVGFLWSHLLLDVLDGGPVPLLFPLVESGVGLRYPARVAFGEGLLGFAVRGPVVALRTTAPRGGFNAFGFLNGFGVASLVAFAAVFVGVRYAGASAGGDR
jgi:membrane-bound metal-dependent hydrolase YbcI (DUF457 family)